MEHTGAQRVLAESQDPQPQHTGDELGTHLSEEIKTSFSKKMVDGIVLVRTLLYENIIFHTTL